MGNLEKTSIIVRTVMDVIIFIIWYKVFLAESEKMTRVSFSMSFRPTEPDCVEPNGYDRVPVPRWILLFLIKKTSITVSGFVKIRLPPVTFPSGEGGPHCGG